MKRHHALLISYFTQRRDEVIDAWGECRDAHPNIKYELDHLFAQLCDEIETILTHLQNDDIVGD